MRITHFETLMANAGLRNYLFIRLHTDTGLTGIGEASLEWQEKTVETLCHEWVGERVVGRDPFDIEAIIGAMIRDQYQGGATVMTAISGFEIALWDIVGKACGQPVYRLLGGRCQRRIPAYANGWYGGARTPGEYAQRAREVVAMGYRAMKFDPFGVAWKDMSPAEVEGAVDLVAAVREAVGPHVGLMIEVHGRLSVDGALDVMRRLNRFNPAWYEEPVAADNLDLLAEVKRRSENMAWAGDRGQGTGMGDQDRGCALIAAGERLYTVADFYRLTTLRAADVVQMDVAHCGGILISKKVAAMAAARDMRISPHCSVGPVALAAALHVDASTPNFMIQEAFAEFDVPWRNALVRGWNPISNGELTLPDTPGLGIDIDDDEIARHPYVKNPFPSLWDGDWLTHFTQTA